MSESLSIKTASLRRGPHPEWLRRIATLFVWVTFVPLKRLLRKRWARMLARGMTRTVGSKFEYQPRAGDVLVCSYFKSGTNWTLQIAVQITQRGNAQFAHIHDIVPWPEMPARTRFAVPAADDTARRQSPTGLRVLKTHLALGPVPYTSEARYICVVRDPKDVFVSSYHFTRANVGAQLMPTVDAWLDTYLSADTALGSWARHLASYWQARERANVLFLTYERMRSDLPAAVDAIAAFLGVQLTAEERAAVIEQSTFEHMKRIGRKFDAPGAPWSTAAGAMIRRGKHGASTELLTAEQQRRIDAYWRAELAGLGCDFPYDAEFNARRPESATDR